MKKIIQIIIIIGFTSCKSQNGNGVWVSLKSHIIDNQQAYKTGLEGMIIDFDKSQIGGMASDSTMKLNIDFKNKVFNVESDTTKFSYKIFKKDSLHIELVKNTRLTFLPLDLNHSISKNKDEIVSYLINNSFEPLNGTTTIDFLNKFYLDIDKNEKNVRLTKTTRNEKEYYGYWSIRQFNQNFFLLFKLDDTVEKSIYQIIAIDQNGINLSPMKEINNLSGISRLNTSL